MAQVNGQQSAMVSPGESRLNTNALGLWGLVIMGIAYMGLALTAYFNFGIMEGITVLIVGYMTQKDIRVSAKVIGWFIAIEAGFVAALALYIIIKQAIAGNLSFQPLNPTAATAGWTGFLNALLFAVLAIAAFDIVAPMAEETRTPRRLVPRATIYVPIGARRCW